MNTQSAVPLLDESYVTLVQQEVSVNVASRDAHNIPSVSRAIGCRLSADQHRATVFFAAPSAAAVLKNIQDNGAIAVTVNRPQTHESVQLKGNDARICEVGEQDYDFAEKCRRSFLEHLRRLDWSEEFCAALLPAVGRDELVAVTFTITSAFLQTPGPNAGKRLQEGR